MRAIRISNKIITTLLRDSLYYPDRLIAVTLSIIARAGVLIILYWYVFRLNNGLIKDTAFDVAAWSMFLYFAFLVFRLREISKAVMADVQSGNIELLLNRPVSYLAYRMWWQVGSGFYSFLSILIIGSLALIFAVGFPSIIVLKVFIPTFVIVFLLGSFLSLLMYLIIGLAAFWIEDINPIFWVVDKAVMILGGSYLPVALFPDFLYQIALWSPFGAALFITHTVYGSWSEQWILKISIQISWIIILGIFVSIIYKKAREKISVNGG